MFVGSSVLSIDKYKTEVAINFDKGESNIQQRLILYVEINKPFYLLSMKIAFVFKHCELLRSAKAILNLLDWEVLLGSSTQTGI